MRCNSSAQTTGKGCLGRRDIGLQMHVASILEFHLDNVSTQIYETMKSLHQLLLLLLSSA